jgi:uncharacterized secreted protein with C-terminal beta-propeller domain
MGTAATTTSIRQTLVSTLAFVALVAGIIAASLVAASPDPAGASGLEQFSSCADLRGWTATSGARDQVLEGEDRAVASPAPAAAEAGADGARNTANLDQGGTNTVVAGVDEIDVSDRIDDDRLLVARNGALALVDLRARSVVSKLVGIPLDARISANDDLVWVVGTSTEGTGTTVRRVRIEGDDLVDGEVWSTPGSVLDARRTGDFLHLVAVDYPAQRGAIPFDGGPVPCEEVWRPVDPATDSSATMVVNLPAQGPLQPTAAAEVVGAGSDILVTADAVYVATTTWNPGQRATGLHRFDLATLDPTGSGSVPGTLAGSFAINEYDGVLRVATSLAGSRGPFPMTMEDGADRAVAPDVVGVPAGGVGDKLAEVFVLDTDGDLDVIGRTGGFGHAGETIHGVRFVGTTAYVVTFLNTDPFWVVDLSDPRTPAVVGELEIPGFSAYLHPLDDDRVVGFGPDGNGHVTARLLDVGDPAAPAVLDEVTLGDDSPVVWDYHAYVGLEDGSFAVPVNDWPTMVEERCVTDLPLAPDTPADGGGEISRPSKPIEPSAPCQPVATGGNAGVAVLGIDGDRLQELDRQLVDNDGSTSAERAMLAPDGTWFLLAWDQLVPTDGAEAIPLPADPAMGGGVFITD